jgi:hypothetical protein
LDVAVASAMDGVQALGISSAGHVPKVSREL